MVTTSQRTKSFAAALRVGISAAVLAPIVQPAFAQAATSTFPCGVCGDEHVVETTPQGFAAPAICASCGAALQPPLVVQTKRDFMTGVPKQGLPQYVLSGGAPDFKNPVNLVEAHPQKAGLCGLRNLSDDAWTVALPDRDPGLLAPGKAICLLDGSDFDFGGTNAKAVRPGLRDTEGPA